MATRTARPRKKRWGLRPQPTGARSRATCQANDPNPNSTSTPGKCTLAIAAGVTPGAHWHNGPVFGVIERGSVFFQVDEDAERVLHAGDTFFEPADTTIARFDATDEGVTFLAWFPMPSAVEPDLIMGRIPDPAT